MRTILIILALCLSACDPIQINVPPIVFPCLLPPEDCAMSDAEFSQKFDAMSDPEQVAYVEKWAGLIQVS